MRKYEGVLVYKPDVDEATRTDNFKRFTDLIEENGELGEISEWGMRRLAYEVDDYKEGYYYIIEFEAEAKEIDELTRIAQISDGIMRYMFTRLDSKE